MEILRRKGYDKIVFFCLTLGPHAARSPATGPLPIQGLDGQHIVPIEVQVPVPGLHEVDENRLRGNFHKKCHLKEGRHDGAPHVRVREAEGVAELVDEGLHQVGPLVRVHRPVLRVVDVNVPSVLGEVSVGQGAAFPVEGSAVTMLKAGGE